MRGYDMDNYEVLEKLTIRVIKYLIIDLNMYNIDEDFLISDVDTLEYNTVTTFIALSGDTNGTVGLSISDELATTIVEKFIFGEVSKDVIEEFTLQTVQEVLNVTMGNIIKDLDIVKNGGKVEISPPFTLDKSEYPTKNKYSKIYTTELKYNNQKIILSYFYK
jgi:CheY-specific phosphatase CheX